MPKQRQRKDKRFGINRVVEEVHRAYDFLERASVEAAEKTLKDEFKFGAIKLARFREAYLLNFGEATERMVLEMRARIEQERKSLR